MAVHPIHDWIVFLEQRSRIGQSGMDWTYEAATRADLPRRETGRDTDTVFAGVWFEPSVLSCGKCLAVGFVGWLVFGFPGRRVGGRTFLATLQDARETPEPDRGSATPGYSL